MSRTIAAVFIAVVLAACGSNEEIVSPIGSAGDLQVSDDWACESTGADEWTCYPAEPEPEPAPSANVVQTDTSQDGLSAGEAALMAAFMPNVQEQPASQSMPEAMETAEPDAEQMSESWVLQLGAFRQLEAAERALAEMGMDGLRIAETERDGERWHVILMGQYPHQGAANEAAKILVDATPDKHVWVRQLSDVEKSTAPAQ